jgi:Leishmanolysin
MGPRATDLSENSLDLITLALFKDSGLYHVDYHGGAQPAFVIGAGCELVIQPCIDNSTVLVPDWVVNEFCDDPFLRVVEDGVGGVPDFLSTNIFCDPAYQSWTLWDLVQFDDESLPDKSYFSLP